MIIFGNNINNLPPSPLSLSLSLSLSHLLSPTLAHCLSLHLYLHIYLSLARFTQLRKISLDCGFKLRGYLVKGPSDRCTRGFVNYRFTRSFKGRTILWFYMRSMSSTQLTSMIRQTYTRVHVGSSLSLCMIIRRFITVFVFLCSSPPFCLYVLKYFHI